jgi:hypothetical protein
MTNPRREQSLEGDMLIGIEHWVYSLLPLGDANVTKGTEPERARRLCEGKRP